MRWLPQLIPGILLACAGVSATAGAQEPMVPLPPSFEGKVVVRDAADNYVPLARPAAPSVPASPPMPIGGDIYLQDGSETSLAINFDSADNLVGVYNEHWDFNPDIPQSNSTDGNVSWTSRSLPNGGGTFTGPPFDPWTHPGNAASEFFSTEIRRDSGSSGTSHTVVSHSTDGGISFSLFFEEVKAVLQDRDMFDVDRTSARGGGAGTTHDGKVYLTYDDYGAGNTGYVGSFLQVIDTAGNPVIELQTSGTGSPPFQGSQMQPVAGVTDGTVYLQAAALSLSPPVGATWIAEFHVITNAGAGPNTFMKSSMSWAAAGQQLGATTRWGLNGFRIDNHGYLAIDRSSGPRRGSLYFISNRNPNPANTALDQGDVYLSVSTDGAMTWTTAAIPTATGKTQYFPMLDVDGQGAMHVAYYQNEDGVLNASTANVYYTNSADGGTTWTTPVQVNAAGNTLNLDNPPPDRASTQYYLIGDYAQLRATGTGDATKVYVLWSGYDRTRPGTTVGNTPDRVLCTTVAQPECLADADCDDANACTADACNLGTCTHHPTVCDDGVQCTVDSCDPAAGCVHAVPTGRVGAGCLLDVAVASASCIQERIPAGVLGKFTRAKALIEKTTLTGNPSKQARLVRGARSALKKAVKLIGKAMRKGKISVACGGALSNAAGEARARL